ncbi:MAG: hypothetical protein COW71_05465 [Ignavibacteriales bacterium CG18_big_fil_WC_8_21_14_2_50_31_20]|nr:MAG: hypothetical protein COW71_05465 [Ignavibacteriales bacterium CG18_big_fil_WC_8_21_14_2_50_31_20]
MDLLDAIKNHKDYTIENGNEIVKKGEIVAFYFEKHSLYKNYLTPKGIDYKKILSAKILPDSALLVGDTIFIIEKKYQEGKGSVDEKLQTCDFKMKQYSKLFSPLNIKVEFYFILSKWFNKPKYNDVFKYIESVGCKYFIEYLPLKELNL